VTVNTQLHRFMAALLAFACLCSISWVQAESAGRFHRLDRNGNGVVTKDEAAAAEDARSLRRFKDGIWNFFKSCPPRQQANSSVEKALPWKEES